MKRYSYCDTLRNNNLFCHFSFRLNILKQKIENICNARSFSVSIYACIFCFFEGVGAHTCRYIRVYICMCSHRLIYAALE